MIEKHVTLKRSDGVRIRNFLWKWKNLKKCVSRFVWQSRQWERVDIILQIRKKWNVIFTLTFYCRGYGSGEIITENNVRSVRPADGMHTMYFEDIVGKKVNRKLIKGTPMMWKFIDWSEDEEKKK